MHCGARSFARTRGRSSGDLIALAISACVPSAIAVVILCTRTRTARVTLMAIDFLIVGGGIGGAVLANLLGQRGQRVVLLEKGRTAAPQARPEVLWPATVESLRTLIPERLEQRWLLPIRGGVVVYRNKELLRFGPEVFDSAGVQPYSTANTRELLLEHAACELQRGMEVTEVLRDGGRVVGVRARDIGSGAEREVLADWTVGDDGMHSVIRRGCGLPMNLVSLPVQLLGFAFDWPARLPVNAVRAWLNKDRNQTGVLGMPVAPLPEGKGVGLIPMWPEVGEDETRLQAALRVFAAQDPDLDELLGTRADPATFTRFRLGFGRTPCFGCAGALLMGDAAHPVTPAGGQGANLSVADALVIAEAALERPKQLLDEYERRRRAPTQRSMSLSRSANRVLSLPRFVLHMGLAMLPWAARRLNNRPARFGRLLRMAAEAFREQPTLG
jgi:2-polyprenyl-6-methoxyphenol hydroxylase-like FAD-dependent oxidoreductase